MFNFRFTGAKHENNELIISYNHTDIPILTTQGQKFRFYSAELTVVQNDDGTFSISGNKTHLANMRMGSKYKSLEDISYSLCRILDMGSGPISSEQNSLTQRELSDEIYATFKPRKAAETKVSIDKPTPKP